MPGSVRAGESPEMGRTQSTYKHDCMIAPVIYPVMQPVMQAVIYPVIYPVIRVVIRVVICRDLFRTILNYFLNHPQPAINFSNLFQHEQPKLSVSD